MPLKPLIAEFGVSWTNHDAWSETYIGVWRLLKKILPDTFEEQKAQDSALCKLAIVGSHQPMELSIDRLLRKSEVSPRKIKAASFREALVTLVVDATGTALDLNEEPFKSTEKVRIMRNCSLHEASVFACVEMARSAIYSTTEGTKSLYAHFGERFPYTHILKRHPLPEDVHFSSNSFSAYCR